MDEREHWVETLLHTVGGRTPEALGGAGADPVKGDAVLHALQPHDQDVIVLLANDLSVQSINAAGRSLLSGAGPWGVADLLHPRCVQDVLGLLHAGFIGDCAGPIVMAGGHRVCLSVRRVYEQECLLVMRDISRIHRQERTRQLARRRAEVSTLAADLAANIATPLAIIEGRIALLQAQPDISPLDLREQLMLLQDHSRRISHTIRNLQAVALTRAPKPEHIRLSSLIDKVVVELGRRLQRIRLERDVPSDCLIYADPVQAWQILTNLLAAALDRTPARGAIRVEASSTGSETTLLVLDEGPPLHSGFLTTPQMDVDDLLSDPGVSFAMAITWMLVRRNGGCLTMRNRMHRGASVSVEMLSKPRLSAERSQPQILVFDPGELLSETVRWMLREEAYTVISASSMGTALYRAGRHAPEAVLVDCAEPGDGSAALMAVLQAEQPELAERVIQVGGTHTPADGAVRSLSKPFTRQQLLAILRQLG